MCFLKWSDEMYLSRVHLNLKKKKTIKAFSVPTLFHGAVEQSFGDERTRNLWRIDCLNDQYYLLVVSHEKPDLSGVVEQFGSEAYPAETKQYDPFLDKLKEGDCWHFRIIANPTKSKKTEERDRGKVKALLSVEDQKQWLVQKGERNGFFVTNDSFNVLRDEWLQFKKKKNGHQVSLLAVTYEGYLTIKDVVLFKEALRNGIGREKAYGMGMLTIANKR